MPYKTKRPGTVIAAAVLLIIYGAVNLTCAICAGASFLGKDADDPMQLDAMIEKDLPTYNIIQTGIAVSNLLVGGMMIVSALGVLRLMRSARIIALILGTYDVLMAILNSIYSIIFVFPVTERIFAQVAQNQPPMPLDFAQFMNGSLWFMLLFSLVTCLALCIPVIILLATRSARAAFAGEYMQDPPPEDYRSRYDDDDDDEGYAPSPRSPRSPGDTGITER